jgi:activator of HSP90 ATPase
VDEQLLTWRFRNSRLFLFSLIAMVLHNPNNWHWVNKDVAPWAREYLEKELPQVSAEQDGVTAKIDKVVSMDGDVDVSQRKGKVITIFDVRLKLEYSGMCSFHAYRLGALTWSAGKNQEGEEASGTITIPEVAHDTEEDEYVVRSLRSQPLSCLDSFE